MAAPDRIKITHQRPMTTPAIRTALERLIELSHRHATTSAWDGAFFNARAALKAEPEGEGPSLQWTDNMPPSETCRYDHCIAKTPFGRFLITWKSWKEYDSPTVDETPWGGWFGAFNSVDDAKAACQQGMNERLSRWGCPTTPPAPDPGEVEDVINDLHRVANALSDENLVNPAHTCRRAATLHVHPIGQQPPNAWGCPECVRELRQDLGDAREQLATAKEAMRRLMRHLLLDFDNFYFGSVYDWYHAGMTGPLPPLPEYLAMREKADAGETP